VFEESGLSLKDVLCVQAAPGALSGVARENAAAVVGCQMLHHGERAQRASAARLCE
jgi:hypothetical protein